MSAEPDNSALPPETTPPDDGSRKLYSSLEIQDLVLRTLVDMMPDRIYAKDTQSRFIFANKAVANLMGASTPAELIGKTDFDCYPEEIASRYFAAEQEILRSGQPLVAFEELVPNLNTGEMGWLQSTKIPLRDHDGRIIGLVGVGRDITQLKQIEAELLGRNSELTELNRRLSQAQEQLVQSEKLASLGRVVAGVAHELNTPLGNAVTVVSTLEDRYLELDRLVHGNQLRRADLLATLEATQKGQALLHRNVGRAAELVRDFKQLAIDQTSDLRREFDLAEVIQEVLVTIQPQFKHTPFELRATLEAGIMMDSFPGPLGQVVTNLALNALIHAFEGRPRGTAQIVCNRLDEAHVKLVCADDGNGMSPDTCQKLFEPFFTTRLGKGGAGLGLYIVHGIVTGLLGGTITFRSAPGQGAEFEVVLPLIAPRPGPVAGKDAPNASDTRV